MAKIHCTVHNDTNASMEVYENENEIIGYCFSCQARVVLEGRPSGRNRRPTNVPDMLNYIATLPQRKIRGFDVPVDDLGFYLVWPERTFYKRRNFSDNPRYTAPRGISAPPYVFKGTSDTAVIVEGEINARSLYESYPTKDTVMSPGSVTKFPSFSKVVQSYSKVVLVVDHDTPGIVYGTELKNLLLKQGKKTILITCATDYNDLFCTEGPEAVAKHFKENL